MESLASPPTLNSALIEPLVTTGPGSVSNATSLSLQSSKLARLNAKVRQQTSAAHLSPDGAESAARASMIIRSSLGVNILLFVSKLITFLTTGSLAVLASLVDSTIDLVAQFILMMANYAANSAQSKPKVDTIYPVGVSRVEPLGVIICAILMVVAAAEVVQKSSATLAAYLPTEHGPPMHFGISAAFLLTGIILLKVVLWKWSEAAAKEMNNVTLEAIALDNQNDVISNLGALAAALLARFRASWWPFDPVGAIVISFYIIGVWLMTTYEQMTYLVGKKASPDFLSTVTEIAETHDPNAQLDVVRAYHFGPKFLVEIEMVMDKSTPLEVSHDVGMLLQDRIEHLDEVERCFVHIDYQHRQEDDHDPSVPITKKVSPSRLGMISEPPQELTA
mmetsp:Transcript_12702/g.28536  ORF Transcript_12702/g.28536 Transcript_12702/m.28536 type:complete len:392 (+) Transcript_12702:90-1265(+)